MTVVRNVLLNDVGSPVENCRVEVYLLAPTFGDPAWRADSAQIIGKTITGTDSDGLWSLDLTPNSEITPANTAYMVAHFIIGQPNVTSVFSVPDSGGPYNLVDLLTSAPGDLPAPGGGSGSGYWYTSATLNDDQSVRVTFNAEFGIDEGTGIPYYDPGNVTPGEEAVLLEDLSLIQPGK